MLLTEKSKITITYIIAIIFITANMILICNEIYYLSLLPLAIIIGWFFLTSLEKMFLFTVFTVPLSINLKDFDIGFGISLPTEPLLIIILLLFLINLLYRNFYDLKLTKHPISIAIIANLIWIFITCFTSALPLVSFKFFLSRLWFVIPSFFLASMIFKEKKYIAWFLWMYIIGFIPIIFYSLYNHYNMGFDGKAAHWVMSPFYNNHTDYGAALAMFIPVILSFALNKKVKANLRLLSFIVFIIFTVAIIFSFTRAAWMSLIIAFGVFIILKFEFSFKLIAICLSLFAIFFFSMQSDIIYNLKKNKQDSSVKLEEHVRSISNISTDASNVERLNRWKCAIKMFNERPITGWGPNTYQFLYAPYQLYRDKNVGSTNAGNLGNAHSEYIGPLADTGVLGSLTFIIIALVSIIKGIILYKKIDNSYLGNILLGVILGLITYLIHGFLNNYLDTEKLAIPFWGFLAIILAIDVYHKKAISTNN